MVVTFLDLDRSPMLCMDTKIRDLKKKTSKNKKKIRKRGCARACAPKLLVHGVASEPGAVSAAAAYASRTETFRVANCARHRAPRKQAASLGSRPNNTKPTPPFQDLELKTNVPVSQKHTVIHQYISFLPALAPLTLLV